MKLGRFIKLAVVLSIITLIYGMTRLPTISTKERSQLSARFDFQASTIASQSINPVRSIRPVHPSLTHIAGWISAVGGAVALHDLDADGLPNDLCYVDTSRDQVTVAVVPGSGTRYAPFILTENELFDRQTMAPMGCVPGDFNEDGWIDILVYYWGRTPIVFLRKPLTENGAEFSAADFRAVEIVRGKQRWFTNAATQADVDGDGHVDLIIGNYFPDGSRVLDANAKNDEQMQSSMSRAYNGGTNRILLWCGGKSGARPSVEFQEATAALDLGNSGIANGWTLAVAAADLDGDLLPEIYLANDFGPDRLLHNLSTPGNPHFKLLTARRGFTVPASKVLGCDSFKGMGVDFGDLDRDGRLDIYVSNLAEEYALEESHFMFLRSGDDELFELGIAPFQDASERLGLSRSGWGWESRLADFDNDGQLEAIQATGFLRGKHNRWPELHEIAMGNDALLSSPKSWHRFREGDDLSGRAPNSFFVRSASGRFFDLAKDVGLGEPQICRGIATADTDGDGDIDIAVGNQWEKSRYYRNDCPQPGSFIGLRLLLPIDQTMSESICRPGLEPVDLPCRPVIGASVSVQFENQTPLVGQVDCGNGHSGVRSPELHFGLGKIPADHPVHVDIHWRTGDGNIRSESFELLPGWHTVLLANSSIKGTVRSYDAKTSSK